MLLGWWVRDTHEEVSVKRLWMYIVAIEDSGGRHILDLLVLEMTVCYSHCWTPTNHER